MKENPNISKMKSLLEKKDYTISEMAAALDMKRQRFETLLTRATFEIPELCEYVEKGEKTRIYLSLVKSYN